MKTPNVNQLSTDGNIKFAGLNHSNPIKSSFSNEEFGALTLRSRLEALDATYGQSPVMTGSGVGDTYDTKI